MAKPGRNGPSAIASNMQKKNNNNKCGDIFFQFFKLLIFVNIDMFTTHISRNCYEKMECIYLKVIQIKYM